MRKQSRSRDRHVLTARSGLAKTGIIFLVLLQLSLNTLNAQNMWLMNQRTHPELEWVTLETTHFNIHYHQGLDSIAHKSAQIAEQCYQPILDQLGLEDFGKTDIVLSAEDEILNGFAMPTRQIFIWVSQNDVAGRFGGSDKWLNLVIPHEFQHVAQFEAHRTWLGIFGATSIPAWWLEGMAEYMTEEWRVGRSDSRMKIHTYRNTINSLDPHDDGYAKVLYLAWKYGDSTLVKISQHREFLNKEEKEYPIFYDFKTAFKESTGQNLKDFNEEWRRVMNTYYYGYKAQKEQIVEVGESQPLKGFARVLSASLAPDSSRIAVVGRKHSRMRDYSIYVQETDSTQAQQEVHYGRFSGRAAWSPDAEQLIIAEYHRGSYGSLLNDLRLIDVNTKNTRWFTKDFRALHPIFSEDGKGVFFVAHPGETTQIYYQALESAKRVQISSFTGDVQLQDLDLSPDGQYLAFMIQEENGDVNIASMRITGADFRKLTDDSEEDLLPVWTNDGRSIVFTSFRNSTPNLYRVDLDSLAIIQMTDVAEGIYSQQRLPNTDRILAATLADVDTVRIQAVKSDRVAPELMLNIREPFMAWRSKAPDISLPEVDYKLPLESEPVRAYKALPTFRPLLRLVLPDQVGLFGLAAYNDALGKHMVQAGGLIDWNGDLAGGYFSYINLQFRPVLSIYAARNFNFNLRRTWGSTQFETKNGVGFSAMLPMNSGNALSTNHFVGLNLRLVNRSERIIEDGVLEFNPDYPEIEEANLGLTWSWLNRRPEADMVSLPRNGYGLLAHMETSMPGLWGTADYSKLWLDGFVNLSIPKTPLVVYSRTKWETHSGNILAQDSIGFMSTEPLYLSPGTLLGLLGAGLYDLPESYSLRGQAGDYPATEIIYNVTELRAPLLKAFPAQFLGFQFTGLTMALFHDFGYLPVQQKSLSTMGTEVKFNLSIGQLPLVVLSAGVGGEADYWEAVLDGSRTIDLESDTYFRLALVNPF
ncbi:MAG: hypothetical protein K9N38_09240 [Candidatus Marinimicrobia bacterium]|nr:hypothetical protein [Candidatus Neomarinimicrobiota bacterium]